MSIYKVSASFNSIFKWLAYISLNLRVNTVKNFSHTVSRIIECFWGPVVHTVFLYSHTWKNQVLASPAIEVAMELALFCLSMLQKLSFRWLQISVMNSSTITRKLHSTNFKIVIMKKRVKKMSSNYLVANNTPPKVYRSAGLTISFRTVSFLHNHENYAYSLFYLCETLHHLQKNRNQKTIDRHRFVAEPIQKKLIYSGMNSSVTARNTECSFSSVITICVFPFFHYLVTYLRVLQPAYTNRPINLSNAFCLNISLLIYSGCK